MTTSDIPSPAAAKPAKVTYLDLPCPIPYEEIHREAIKSLKQEHTEGGRVDLTKIFNENFFITHSIMAGLTEIPSQSSKIIKTPTTNYEFGANYTDSEFMLSGKMTMDGRLNATFKYDFTHNLALEASAQLTYEPHKYEDLVNFYYKGSDYRARLRMGSGALLSASYIQSVSPHLSLGGEVFLAGHHRKSGFGYAARYNTDKMVAVGQFCSSGLLALSYVQKLSKRACLASDFMYNSMSKDVTASFGYDYYFDYTKVQWRGKIDSNGVVVASAEFMEFMIHSFEFDYIKQDFKFGLRFVLNPNNPFHDQSC